MWKLTKNQNFLFLTGLFVLAIISTIVGMIVYPKSMLFYGMLLFLAFIIFIICAIIWWRIYKYKESI